VPVSRLPDILVVPHGVRAIPPDGVIGLYRAVGWWPERTAEQIGSVLSASPAAGAWRGERLIGFARAVTDGVLRAYVEDIVVAPDQRGHGAGRELLACLMQVVAPVPLVSLFCAAELVPFYETCSFRATRQRVMHRSR
jgi:GNAT superfamily N-acetyltransferase